ncbi:protein NO VEIN-like isoform X2 [Vicia villosa]|uniref:protein NO VEIN-like isoform X2 n=1 Tax=Vicia villosa TaxID=3911 RepID=UPI00273C2E79|nr:protein NO VEIN-like isoform X2 [Vicia villosa]
MVTSLVPRELNERCTEISQTVDAEKSMTSHLQSGKDIDSTLVIESIRQDEFGLDPSLSDTDSCMLKKQHARNILSVSLWPGRALHCLSQELYSQDSHFILELVQNADDNNYPERVEPTLAFILQDSGIAVLNNEQDAAYRAALEGSGTAEKGRRRTSCKGSC